MDCRSEVSLWAARRIDHLVLRVEVLLNIHSNLPCVYVRLGECAFELVIDDDPYTFFERLDLDFFSFFDFLKCSAFSPSRSSLAP